MHIDNSYRDTYRMYGLVPYQLTGIQQAIQFGHAVVEYSQEYFNAADYQEWAKYCKTFIILNGGTTNDNLFSRGTLNQHVETIEELGLQFATFREPDLGNQLTAVVFLVPEQVYNRKAYPDFYDWEPALKTLDASSLVKIKFENQLSEDAELLWKEWLDFIGGEKNYQLREFLKQFRLA